MRCRMSRTSSLPAAPFAPRIVWERVGRVGSQHNILAVQLAELYWTGVRRDVVDILKALRTWNNDEWVTNVFPQLEALGEGGGSSWTGFGTFVNRAIGKDQSDV